MTFSELLAVVLSSAGLFAAILWAFVTYAVRKNAEANKELMRVIEEGMTTSLTQMNRRADERQGDTLQSRWPTR